MEKRRKSRTEPLVRMCQSEASWAVREFLAKVGDKWSLLVLVMLAKVPGQRARFSELQRMVEGISHRMLTTTLRDLERDGFVSREVFAEVPPRVEYELTPMGRGLLGPIQQLVDWIGGNWNAIQDARARFDKPSGSSPVGRHAVDLDTLGASKATLPGTHQRLVMRPLRRRPGVS